MPSDSSPDDTHDIDDAQVSPLTGADGGDGTPDTGSPDAGDRAGGGRALDTDDDIDGDADGATTGDVVGDAQEAIEEARRRLAEVPAQVVVTNHVMGLYELAAIHLSAEVPDLRSAALAIDAVASLVDGLGDRLGDEAPTMRDALANIRMAFVRIKAAAAPSPSPSADDPGV